MAKNVQFYRLAQANLNDERGRVGQAIVNLSNFAIHVMDGATPGGHAHALASLENVADATTSSDGKMTKEMVAELNTATSNISTLTSSLGTTNNTLTTLSATVATKAAKVSPATVNHIALLTAGGDLKTAGMPFFNEGTLLKFASALPSGFTLNTSFNDMVDLNVSDANTVGQTAGSWSISGLSVDAHDHDLGGHGHGAGSYGVTVASEGVDDNPGSGVFVGRDGSYAVSGTSGAASGNTGAASPGITAAGSWRPAHVKTIWGARNAIS